MAASVEVSPQGVVTLKLPAKAGEASRMVGIRLDGRDFGAALARASGRRRLRLCWALPPDCLAARFAVVDDAETEIAGTALELRAHFGLELAPPSAGFLAMTGGVRGPARLAAELAVMLHDGAVRFAAGVARRGADGWHRFRIAPDRLPATCAPIRLTLTVGGLTLPDMVVVRPDELGVQGAVDGAGAAEVTGWIAGPPGVAGVALLQDGAVVERAVASSASGAARRRFRLRRPESGPVQVVLDGTGIALPGSPAWPHGVQGLVERVSRSAIHGWARDPAAPTARLRVEAVVDGEVLAVAAADGFRGDVAEAGLGDGSCGFRLDLSAHALRLGDRVATVRLAGGGAVLDGPPCSIAGNAALLRHLQRQATIAPAVQARLRRMMDHRAGDGGVSVVLALDHLPAARLPDMIEALRRQWCGAWEALCVTHKAARPMLADARLRLLAAPRPGLAAAMNAGLAAARHGRVLFLTSPASLEPDAIHHLLHAPGEALLYWDEAVLHADRGIADAACRGAFSPALFAERADLGTGFCLPTATARALGGWRGGRHEAFDFVSRALASVPTVAHLPRMLARLTVTGALRPGEGGTALPAPRPRPPVPAAGEVLVVIPTRNRVDLLARCLDSLDATTGVRRPRIVVIDHESDDPATRHYLAGLSGRAEVMPYHGPFNYAAMNNAAVRRHAGDAHFVLFLNNDTEALQPGWLDRLCALAAGAHVGAVGALLLYPDRRVQHGGVVLGVGGAAGHAFPFDAAWRDGARLPGPQGLLESVRDVSAVTAACMAMTVAAFRAVGGFDAAFPVGFNDTDLCLRLRRAGLRILQDGHTMMLHHESPSRRQSGQVLHADDTIRFQRRWRRQIAAGDPYHSPHLSLIAADWELRPDCAPPGRLAPRMTRPDGRPLG